MLATFYGTSCASFSCTSKHHLEKKMLHAVNTSNRCNRSQTKGIFTQLLNRYTYCVWASPFYFSHIPVKRTPFTCQARVWQRLFVNKHSVYLRKATMHQRCQNCEKPKNATTVQCSRLCARSVLQLTRDAERTFMNLNVTG